MKKVRTKNLIFVIVIIILFAGALLYYKPLALSGLIKANQEVNISTVFLGSKNGMAYNNAADYNALTDEQKKDIINLFQQYSYKRTLGTITSDGSFSGSFNQLLHIFIYEDGALVNMISLSNADKISVNDKTYTLKNSSDLIAKLLEIINK